jgi:uncharacterized protein YfaP (DUF2135 family)
MLATLVVGGVQAQTTTIDFANSRGAGTTADKVLIENVRVLVAVPNPFSPGTNTTVETVYNVSFKFDYTTLHLVPEGITQTGGAGATNCAQASVQVTNAVLGAAAPLAGATVTIGGQTATTNSLGVANLSNLPSGATSVGVVSPGYVSASQIAALSCTAVNTIAVALSPATGTTGGLTSGQFRVILTWGQNPGDLDSHLTGPNTGVASDTNRWHLYFGNKTAGGICGLDVDDTSSYGPETVTCPSTGSTGTALLPGVYRYSVHHYSGSNNIGSSGASVRLEFANGTVYTYTPPTTAAYTTSKDVWTVFELTVNANGTISVAPVNTVTNVSSAGTVRGAISGDPIGYGMHEDGSLFKLLSK